MTNIATNNKSLSSVLDCLLLFYSVKALQTYVYFHAKQKYTIIAFIIFL